MALRESLKFLTDEDIRRLEEVAADVEVAAGECLVTEGERTHCLYVVVSGVLRVEKAYLGGAVPIAELLPGDIFGEMSMIDAGGASASVTAETPARVSRLAEDALQDCFKTDPAAQARFYRSLAYMLSVRLRGANSSFVSGMV